MSEVQAYVRLRRAILYFKPSARVDRIENAASYGMADVNLNIDGVESWVEIKCPTEPKRATTPLFGSNHKLSQGQMNFFLRHNAAGGNGWVLIETDRRVMLLDGMYADDINKLAVPELITLSDATQSRPLKRESWNRFITALSTRQVL